MTKQFWRVPELAYLYHLILWGYTVEEIVEVGVDLLKRTPDAIRTEMSHVRKFISHKKGLPVSNFNFSERVIRDLEEAATMPIPLELNVYKRDTENFRPVKVFSEKIPGYTPEVPKPEPVAEEPKVQAAPSMVEILLKSGNSFEFTAPDGITYKVQGNAKGHDK